MYFTSNALVKFFNLTVLSTYPNFLDLFSVVNLLYNSFSFSTTSQLYAHDLSTMLLYILIEYKLLDIMFIYKILIFNTFNDDVLYGLIPVYNLSFNGFNLFSINYSSDLCNYYIFPYFK